MRTGECQPVADADLRPVWRNTTQSPAETWDNPVYEQVFRRVRAVNWALPPGKRIRVLAGDPPIDWSTVTSPEQLSSFNAQRDTHAASVVEQQVLAKGRRALVCYGEAHVLHGSDRSELVTLIEQKTGVRTCVILDLAGVPGNPAGLDARLAGYPRGTVIPAAGTWLGKYPFCGGSLGEILDAGLYLGQPAELTVSWPNPAIYLDPAYWAELQRRNAIWASLGNGVDLSTYRQEQPPVYPLVPQAVPAC